MRVGGLGTPSVAEFAWAELGARLQVSPWSARQLVADALDVRHRLPLIWARVLTGQARVGHARRVAARTRHLSVEAAGAVDAAMVDFVDGSLPWGRFESRLAGRIVKADPAAAAEREAAAQTEQLARRTRSSEHGIAGFYVRSTVGVIARLDATVAFLADALKAFGDPDPEDLRRVKAVAVLANPVRAVELLAAFAALRTDTVDVALPRRGRTRRRRWFRQAQPAERRPAGGSTNRWRVVSTSSTNRCDDRQARPTGGCVGADGCVRAAGRVHPHPTTGLARPTRPDRSVSPDPPDPSPPEPGRGSGSTGRSCSRR